MGYYGYPLIWYNGQYHVIGVITGLFHYIPVWSCPKQDASLYHHI